MEKKDNHNHRSVVLEDVEALGKFEDSANTAKNDRDNSRWLGDFGPQRYICVTGVPPLRGLLPPYLVNLRVRRICRNRYCRYNTGGLLMATFSCLLAVERLLKVALAT